VVAGLSLAGVGGQAATFLWGFDEGLGWIPAFSLDEEQNIPTWYQSCAMLLSAVLLGVIAQATRQAGRRHATHWSLLSLLFVLLSLDEVVGIHERWMLPMRAWLRPSGMWYFAWVIPAIVFVLVVGVAYSRFLAGLPRRTQALFLLAAGIYVGGELGLEMAGAYQFLHAGAHSLAYAMVVTIEEILGMLGIVVFIHALLEYLSVQYPL